MYKFTVIGIFVACFLSTCFASYIDRNAPLHIKNQQAVELGGSPREFFDILPDGNEYYFAFDTFRTWHDASSFCNVLGMKLVSLESEEKDLLIGTYVNELGTDVGWWWTSGIGINNEYIWSGIGKMFTHTGWSDGQPTGPINTDGLCVNFVGEGPLLQSWKDNTCHYQYHYVCEYTL